MLNKNLPFGLLAILLVILLAPSCRHASKEEKIAIGVSDTSLKYLEALNKKISADGKNAGLYNLRARFYINDRQFNKALKDINQALSLNPKDASFYVTLSDLYLLTGEPQKCSDALKKALTISPKDNDALIKFAKLSLIQRDYKSTFENLKKALDNQPVNPKAHFLRALALLENGDTLKAVDDLRKAVDQDQHYFDAYVQLGDLYTIKKDKLAAEYYRAALNIHPGSREVLYSLGMFYQESGQYDKAIETYTTLGKVDSTFKNAPYNIGYIYLVYLHDFNKAVSCFSEAIKRSPAYVEAWYNRGYSYELMGQNGKAYDDYQKTLQISTNYQKAIDGLNRLDKSKKRR
ncbi:MAG: tetratricopeptide repeat protein [Bacteroidota bacterium]|nr:tetratricopeptide repeat protein [Bacteroidota bacterium]